MNIPDEEQRGDFPLPIETIQKLKNILPNQDEIILDITINPAPPKSMSYNKPTMYMIANLQMMSEMYDNADLIVQGLSGSSIRSLVIQLEEYPGKKYFTWIFKDIVANLPLLKKLRFEFKQYFFNNYHHNFGKENVELMIEILSKSSIIEFQWQSWEEPCRILEKDLFEKLTMIVKNNKIRSTTFEEIIKNKLVIF